MSEQVILTLRIQYHPELLWESWREFLKGFLALWLCFLQDWLLMLCVHVNPSLSRTQYGQISSVISTAEGWNGPAQKLFLRALLNEGVPCRHWVNGSVDQQDSRLCGAGNQRAPRLAQGMKNLGRCVWAKRPYPSICYRSPELPPAFLFRASTHTALLFSLQKLFGFIQVTQFVHVCCEIEEWSREGRGGERKF